jgi:hypothetical protein
VNTEAGDDKEEGNAVPPLLQQKTDPSLAPMGGMEPRIILTCEAVEEHHAQRGRATERVDGLESF